MQAMTLSMIHLLRLPTNEGGQKPKRNILSETNDLNDNEQRPKMQKDCVIKEMSN